MTYSQNSTRKWILGVVVVADMFDTWLYLNHQPLVTSNGIISLEVHINKQQTLSGKCPSHINPSLSKRKLYTEIHIQAHVLSSLCHNKHWPWRSTDLCDTAKHYSTMCIFMCDHPLWWKSIVIIKNKPEPSNLHCILLRLCGFHTLKICLRLWITSWQVGGSGHYLHLLMLKTPWLTS